MGKRKNVTDAERDFYVWFGLRLRHARGEKGLSQKKMAARIGRSITHITDCERGVRSPTAYELKQWGYYTDHTPNYFFDMEDQLDLEEVTMAKKLTAEIRKLSMQEKNTLLKLIMAYNGSQSIKKIEG